MTGTITKYKLKNGRKSWGYVFTTGYAGGKRQQTIKKGFKTEREAQEALRIALGTRGEDVKVVRDERTFGAYFTDWLKTHGAKKWGAMTCEQNAKRAAYAIRKFGDVPLLELTHMQLERGLAELLAKGGRKDGPLSRKTVRSVEALIAQALKKAAKDHFIGANPMDLVDRTPANKTEVQIPQADDYEKLLDVMQGTRYYAFAVMAAASGCRRGELLALKWSDLDAKTGMLAVAKSVSVTKAGGLEIKTTKSRKSRFVRISRATLRVLLEHRKLVEHEKELFGAGYKPHDLIFPTPDGSYYSPDRVTNRISEFMAKAGINASLHSLRHLHASMMLSMHVPIPIVSKRLGHANSQVTLEIYSHAMKNDESAAADLWDDATADIIGRTEKRPQNGPLSFVIPVLKKAL
jgi:integrase